MSAPRIWALLGPRRGDNNQLLALCEALGLPFETRTLSHNPLRVLGSRLLGASTVSLTHKARARLAPPWPDLLILIGRRSVPVARHIRRKSGMRTRLVVLGNPRLDPRHFDLVITTPQYPVPDAANVLRMPLTICRSRRSEPSGEERAWLQQLPRPHLLFLLGGTTKDHRLKPGAIASAAETLTRRAEVKGGSLIVCSSPRTDKGVIAAVRASVAGSSAWLIDGDFPSYPVLLADADEMFVTGDSMSMLSEAAISGKPVGLAPVEITARGRLRLGSDARHYGFTGRRRDIRRSWSALLDGGIVGTIEEPRCAPTGNPVDQAASAVLKLLGKEQ